MAPLINLSDADAALLEQAKVRRAKEQEKFKTLNAKLSSATRTLAAKKAWITKRKTFRPKQSGLPPVIVAPQPK